MGIAAGFYYSLALTTSGQVYAWGYNNRGQLGDGSTTDRPTPVQALCMSSVSAIAAGGFHSLAIGVQAAATPPTDITASVPSGTVGEPYTTTLSAVVARPPATWAVVSGSLRAGLSLNATTGLIGGTPTGAGTFPFTIQVADVCGASASQQLTITIEAARTSTISFDANGGQGAMSDVRADSGMTFALPPNAFSKAGYVFVGWNTAADGGGTPYTDEAEIVVTADITLYAQWIEAEQFVAVDERDRRSSTNGCRHFTDS